MAHSQRAADSVDLRSRSTTLKDFSDTSSGWLIKLQRALLPRAWKRQQEGFQSLKAHEQDDSTLEFDSKPDHPRGTLAAAACI